MVTPVFADGEGNATHIYVLTAPEDHGWTGSVATFAKEKIEEVNDAGTYSAELITSADAAEQIVNIEDIIAAGEDNIAVVIQPIDDTVQSAIQQLVDAEIPYVAFDRIIEGVADSAVSNVKGDNEGIGAACAAYYTCLLYTSWVICEYTDRIIVDMQTVCDGFYCNRCSFIRDDPVKLRQRKDVYKRQDHELGTGKKRNTSYH